MFMKKILVAEDNDSNYLLMSYILKRNYELIRAENGREAVNIVESESVDLVGICRPGSDGSEDACDGWLGSHPVD